MTIKLSDRLNKPMANENKTSGSEPAVAGSLERVVSRPSLEELESAWADLWKHLGEPEYSPSAISLAKHCFMVGQEWGANRAANSKSSEDAGRKQ